MDEHRNERNLENAAIAQKNAMEKSSWMFRRQVNLIVEPMFLRPGERPILGRRVLAYAVPKKVGQIKHSVLLLDRNYRQGRPNCGRPERIGKWKWLYIFLARE